ncbi:hypothetical protein AMTRI_Chr01g132320 [Amborella trichopoda]
MQPHVIHKIEKFPDKLQDKLQWKKFLSCLNYIQDFIDKLSKKTKKTRLEVRNLKTEAQSLPPLAPVYGGHFILCTYSYSDTCTVVLLKKYKKKKRICTYTSGQFKKHELNY